MNTDSTEGRYIANISKKETYSAEEKAFILKRLNNERILKQKSEEECLKATKIYTIEEKNGILKELNEKRLRTQKYEEMKRKRLENKQIYEFGNKQYYKFIGMKREFYVDIEYCGKFSGKPNIVTLYYMTFNKLKKKDVLIRTESDSEKIFISYDAIRIYFKPYSLENKY